MTDELLLTKDEIERFVYEAGNTDGEALARAQVEKVAAWLNKRGREMESYTAGVLRDEVAIRT